MTHAVNNADQAYRALRVRLMANPEKEIVLTALTDSTLSAEVAGRLGRVLAQAGQETVLSDAALKSRLLGSGDGVWEWLSGKATRDAVSQPTETDHLTLIPAGQPGASVEYPTDMLLHARFAQEVGKLDVRFVIIHTEPILTDPNTALVGANADGVILVVRKGESTLDEIIEAQARFNNAQAQLLGAIWID